MKACRTVDELREALDGLPGQTPLTVYYEGHCCYSDVLAVRGIHDGRMVLDTEDGPWAG